MAFAHYLMAAAPVETSNAQLRKSILAPPSPPSISSSLLSYAFSSLQPKHKTFKLKLSFFSILRKLGQKAKAKPQEAEVPAVDSFGQFKRLLLPIKDQNPYLSEAAATTASLARKYGAEITVVVIDEKEKETIPEHETQLSSIRWLLSEGGFQEFKLLERLGEVKKPTAIIGEVADDMNLEYGLHPRDNQMFCVGFATLRSGIVSERQVTADPVFNMQTDFLIQSVSCSFSLSFFSLYFLSYIFYSLSCHPFSLI